MPRDGSNVYSLPAGTTATTNTTIESAKYNAFVSDVEADLNVARPVVAGGTGASTASGARTNLGLGTIATQAASSVAITGGAIDGAAIGGSTPAAGAFTTLSSSGAATLASASITGNLTFGGTALTDTTGADTKLVSGTAGSDTDFGMWNADGDLVGGSLTYTRGSLIYGGAAAWGKLAVGTAGQVLTADGTDVAWATLTVGGVTELGTITTTSGSSQSLTSLDLTEYKFLVAVYGGVSTSTTSGNHSFPQTGCNVAVVGAGGNQMRGFVIIDLANGVGFSLVSDIASTGSSATATANVIYTTLSTASTSVTAAISAGSFDLGSILVYGVK